MTASQDSRQPLKFLYIVLIELVGVLQMLQDVRRNVLCLLWHLVFAIDELDEGSRVVAVALLRHGGEVVCGVDRARNHLKGRVLRSALRVIYILVKLGLRLDSLSDNWMGRDSDKTCDSSLQIMLDHLKSARACVRLNPEQVLLESMHKHHIDSFTAEKISEEKLDRVAEVIHAALLHNFVHRFEHKVLIHDLSTDHVIDLIVVQDLYEYLLEYLVRCW